MIDRPCITFELQGLHRHDRPRACHRRGQTRDGRRIPEGHYAACDDEDCRGCVPRSARHGLLCDVCWMKARDAIDRAYYLILHLRSIESGAQNAGERVDTSRRPQLIVPETWMAADDLLEALGARPFPSTMGIDAAFEYVDDVLAPWRADLEGKANTVAGASALVRLTLRMQTALHRWPAAEAEHRSIPFVLCPQCGHKDLFRRGPLEYLDDILIECGSCDYKRDWFEWSEHYAPILAGMFKEMDAAERKERAERRAARRKELISASR
ncbi:hypothetical protein [Microbacterium arborescens]|uniref:hypothetical protein n=1 Tax=Microbacterium arborescens TaxID=33883 RepID=UPI000DF750CC|nr:hypothetical protein [Microbacterium arborescens]